MSFKVICDTNVILYSVKKNKCVNLTTISPVLSELPTNLNIKLKVYPFLLNNNEPIDDALIRFASLNNNIIYTYDRGLILKARTKKVYAKTPNVSDLYYL